jgi:hypothetical protein
MLRIAVAASLLVGSGAQAQLFRAYLAADGSDAFPCTLPAPCRLLPAALNAVAAGGEIWMLDSANYNSGTVTISKDVSILAVPGVVGSLVATGGPAISISAANLKVALRNLVIAPVATLPAGTMGVNMPGASSLTIENCLIANLPEEAVRVDAAGTLKVANSTLRNNGAVAISLQRGATATVASTQMLGNAGGGVGVYGYYGSTTTTASVSDSVVSGGFGGVIAFANNSTAVARVSVTSSMIERTLYALKSQTSGIGSADVNVGSSLIVDNEYAWDQSGTGSTLLSLGDNQMSGNQGAIGTRTPLPPQ